MGKIKLVKSKKAKTGRNARHYFNSALPYVSLIISVVAILKAYNVII